MSFDPAIERVRLSRLKWFARSPAHFWDPPQPATKGTLDKGSAVHSVLLKGARVTYYDKVTEAGAAAPRRGKDWDAFQAANQGALILSRAEYDVTQRAVDAVRANGEAMELLTGKIEDTIEFSFLGLPCRTTPDARTPTTVVELKTTRSAAPLDFAWQSKKLLYHAQMAFHIEGMATVNPSLNPTPYVVAVEMSKPYCVQVYRMPAPIILAGHRLVRGWFEQLRGCLASGNFPGYAQAAMELELPGSEAVVFDDEEDAAA